MKKGNLNKILLFGVALVMATGMSSCNLTKKYKSPEVESEELFRDEIVTEQSDTTTIADIPWRQYFTDPVLVALIEEGLENNFDLMIAYQRILQAEANLRIARNAYFPTVSVGGSVTHTRSSNGLEGRDILGYHNNQYSLAVAVSWEADIWGKLSRQKRAQYASYLSSLEYRNLIQTSLISNIAASYYSLMALDEQLRVTLEMIDIMDKSTETMEALMIAGQLTAASVEQSKAQAYSTRTSIPDLKSTIRQTENALSVLIGRNPGPIDRNLLASQVVNEAMDHGVPLQMLSRRPDVSQAELAFRSAFEMTGAARASLYPSLTLGTSGSAATLGYVATSLDSFFDGKNLVANIIGGLAMPVIAGKQLRSNVKIAEAQQQEALITFKQTVLSAGQEVSDIIYGFRSSLSKNADREQQVESLDKAVYYTNELLKAGEANYTEVLSAESSLLSAKLNQVSDKLEQLQYNVTLYKALGGGVE